MDHKPKLGGYRKIVKMNESHFAGTPKYRKGRRNGEDPWNGYNKWVFGLTQLAVKGSGLTFHQ